MYNYAYSWLVLGSTLNKSVPFLDDSAYGMTTNLALAIANGRDYDLYDVFNHCKYRGGTLNVTGMGFWRAGTGLTITLTQPLVQRRANMNGMTLKMSGVVCVYYNCKKSKGNIFNLYRVSTCVQIIVDTIQAEEHASGGLHARHQHQVLGQHAQVLVRNDISHGRSL